MLTLWEGRGGRGGGGLVCGHHTKLSYINTTLFETLFQNLQSVT